MNTPPPLMPAAPTVEWFNDCDRMLYTRIPYKGRLPGKWQNGFSIFIEAHKSLGEGAANQIRDHIKVALDTRAQPSPMVTEKLVREMIHHLGITFTGNHDRMRAALLAALGGGEEPCQ